MRSLVWIQACQRGMPSGSLCTTNLRATSSCQVLNFDPSLHAANTMLNLTFSLSAVMKSVRRLPVHTSAAGKHTLLQ